LNSCTKTRRRKNGRGHRTAARKKERKDLEGRSITGGTEFGAFCGPWSASGDEVQ